LTVVEVGVVVLLAGFGSGVVEVTLAVFWMTVPSATLASMLTTIVNTAASALGEEAFENVMVPLPPTGTTSVRVQVAGVVTDTRLVPAGIASLTTALRAAAGPALL
jgi:hypothetical protein